MGLNTTPATAVASTVLTAAFWNTEVRDAITGIEAAGTSWTPTVASGLTIGNGTWVAAYSQVGKWVRGRFAFTMGSTSSVTGAILILYPIAINTSYPTFTNTGSASLYDVSATTLGRLPAAIGVNSTASSGVGSFLLDCTGGQANATVPFTWATGDVFSGTLTYEAA
jgi:hypothetical protein